ncbi:hypothetical protein [Actinokineospora iranica]|uniref:Uncharacterized protein n=1 Tax=Actinokineospora iranica TaxID=1271860 RepID=A0A1G6PGX7_9PSEU|nr:hypothetical protein [Actinokineospora iranica]SDC78605.1 hypothetical protein SAMN05216174_104264 [Actinokineospora iranica]
MELLRSTTSPAAGQPARRLDEHHRDLRDLRDGLHGSVGERRVWRVSCGDVINRDRCLTVLVEKNKVVLVGPPGETAVLTAGQLGQLRVALREAAEQAER